MFYLNANNNKLEGKYAILELSGEFKWFLCSCKFQFWYHYLRDFWIAYVIFEFHAHFIKYFLASSDFYRLLIPFANSLDPGVDIVHTFKSSYN